MRVGWLAALLALGLAVALPAQAAPATITVRAELPLQVDGVATATATGETGRFLLEGNAGTVTLGLDGLAGTATRVVHRMWGYLNTMDPKLGIVWDDEVQKVPLSLSGARLDLAERRPGFQVLAYGGELALTGADHDASLLLGALDSARSIDRPLGEALLLHLAPPSDADAFHQDIPTGSLQARATAGSLAAAGPVTLFVNDAVVHYVGPSGPAAVLAHFREEVRPGTLFNPLTRSWTGPGSHTEYVQEYLLVEALEAAVRLDYTGTPGSLFAPASELAIDGTARLPKADGTVTVTDDDKTTRHELDGTDLAVSGLFTLRAHDVLSNPARATFDGDGEVTHVAYRGVAAHYDWSKAAAAAGLGAALLAIAGWLAVHAKAAGPAAAGLVAGYARVSGHEVLDHAGRSEVYDHVKGNPGIAFAELAAKVGFGHSTLTYHLRVLEKNGFVASVKDGRYLRYFDRTAGTYAGQRKHAVSALRNRTTAAIARHIQAHPGVVQRDLAAAFGVTASTVNWHIARLEAAGLVQRQRAAHFTHHYIAEGWTQLPAEEAQRQAAEAQVPLLVA